MYGGVRGRKTRVGEKLHRFPPTRLKKMQKIAFFLENILSSSGFRPRI